jgi:hypothetical protein
MFAFTGLLDDMIREAAASSAGYLVMVMDDTATRVISPVLRMYDIMEEKITRAYLLCILHHPCLHNPPFFTVVEKLALNRQPFPEMEVIYLIAPTEESVNRVLTVRSLFSRYAFHRPLAHLLPCSGDRTLQIPKSLNMGKCISSSSHVSNLLIRRC